MSLCFRCEHRAKFLEEGYGPRHECKDVETSKFICYCYQPVKPIVLKYPDCGDAAYNKANRERDVSLPWCIAPRLQFDSVVDDSDYKWVHCMGLVDANENDKYYYTYWRPTTLDEQNEKLAKDEAEKKHAKEMIAKFSEADGEDWNDDVTYMETDEDWDDENNED
jgi:hypothetical protein